jgi:hypothetical protein
MVLKAVPCLRRLFAGLSQRTPRFHDRSVRVRSVLDTVALGQVFLQVCPFSFNYFLLLLHLQVAVSKIAEHWAGKHFTLYTLHFPQPLDEARNNFKVTSYWCCLLLIKVCSYMKGNWDEDWTLWICLTSSVCTVSWVIHKYSPGQRNAAVDC